MTEIEGWPVGLTICYDLRFPELYRVLALEGALLATVPAHFTLYTGKDHWDLLLRARAVENGFYVAAPAQVGETGIGRPSYGRALIADPWGTVVAQAPDEETVISAELDRAWLDEVRRRCRRCPSAGPRRTAGRRPREAQSSPLRRRLHPRQAWARPRAGRLPALGRRFGLELDPSRYAEARAAAVETIERHPELDHDEEVWVLFTERIIRGMGGDSDRAYECAVEMTRGWEHAENFELYEDTLPVLAVLREHGLKIGLVSNTGRDLDAFIEHHALDVDAAVGSGAHGKTKPHPAIFLSALERSAWRPRSRRWSATRPRTMSTVRRRSGCAPSWSTVTTVPGRRRAPARPAGAAGRARAQRQTGWPG